MYVAAAKGDFQYRIFPYACAPTLFDKTMTSEEFSNHSIHQAIALANSFRGTNLLRIALNDSPESAKTYIDQIFAVVRVIESYLVATPHELISPYGLLQIASHLHEVNARLEEFGNSHQLEPLASAATTISQNVQSLLWTFAQPPDHEAGNVYSEMLSRYKKFAEDSINKFSHDSAEMKIKLGAQIGEVNELRAVISSMNEDAAHHRAKASAEVAELKTKYYEDELARKIQHDEAMQVRLVEASKLHEASKTDAESILDKLKNYESEASRTYSTLGQIAVTGSYQIVADAEAKQANLLRNGAITVFAIAVFVAVFSLFKYIDQTHTTETVISMLVRIGTAITITLPGWYLARESARHRSTADRARQTEMELASLGPFIELMEKNKKDAIREELIKKYFGNGVQEHTVSAPFTMPEFTGLVAELGKLRGGESK